MSTRKKIHQRDQRTRSEHELSRRAFLESTATAIVVATAIPTLEAQTTAARPAIAADPTVPRTTIRLTVNGTVRRVEVEDRWTLVELLRDHFGLTGTKIGCDRGECGACTVIIGGRNMYSCSQLAVWMEGKEILTIEGLAKGDKLDPLQEAFIEHD